MSEIKIGFIGIGTMGEHMCRNIMKKGTWPVSIYDINEDQVEKLAKEGATPCKDIKELAAASNVIISMVPTNDDVRDVVENLLPTLKKGTIYIDMSTISPDVSIELSKKVEATGATMLDVPVVKSQGAAIAGNLGIYAAGDELAYKKIRPILECMGKPEEIIYFAENGKGLAMKMCHNMLVGIIQSGVYEMIIMAKAPGIPYDKIAPGIAAGGGQNFYLDAKAESIKKDDFKARFSFRNMHKDMHLILDFAEELGLNLEAAKHVASIYDKGIEEVGSEDFSATIKIVEKLVKK